MVGHYVGLTVDKASILSLDALGMNLAVSRGEDSFKIRLPFEAPALDRSMVKKALVGRALSCTSFLFLQLILSIFELSSGITQVVSGTDGL